MLKDSLKGSRYLPMGVIEIDSLIDSFVVRFFDMVYSVISI
jgi:hypothetical protein